VILISHYNQFKIQIIKLTQLLILARTCDLL